MDIEVLKRELRMAIKRREGQKKILAETEQALEFATTNKMPGLMEQSELRRKRQHAALDLVDKTIAEIEEAIGKADSNQMDLVNESSKDKRKR